MLLHGIERSRAQFFRQNGLSEVAHDDHCGARDEPGGDRSELRRNAPRYRVREGRRNYAELLNQDTVLQSLHE